MTSGRRSGTPRAAAITGVACLAAVKGKLALACPPPGNGFYTQAQANTGHAVFDQHRAPGNNAELSGGAGPALAGTQFPACFNSSKITGFQLFDFISTQIPYAAPGRLSGSEYQDAFASILSVNRYPAGSVPLDARSASCGQEMLPYPKRG